MDIPAPAFRYHHDLPPPPTTTTAAATSSSISGSVTMVVITVVGVLAAFALLASYYAFVTRCQLLRSALSSRSPPWRGRGREPSTVIRAAGGAAGGAEDGARGLGLPLIRMLPVVKFTSAAAAGEDAGRVSVSTECAVCLSEFAERERVRLLPNCSHAFHIDCIDTWLQGSARCPFCRSDVTLPPAHAHHPPPLPPWRPISTPPAPSHRDEPMIRRHNDDCSIAIEGRGALECWVTPAAAAARPLPRKAASAAESVGDEAIDTRTKKDAGEFAVQPMRRSLSLDSSCHKQLYVSLVRELLTQQS